MCSGGSGAGPPGRESAEARRFGWAERRGETGAGDESKRGRSLATRRLGTVQQSHADSRGQGRSELVLIWEEGGMAWVLGRGGKVRVETEKVGGGSFYRREVFLFPLVLWLWPTLPHAS